MRFCLLTLTFLFLLSATGLQGEDDVAPPASKSDPAAQSVDIYKLPANADVPALVKFMETLSSFEPQTAQEALLHRKKARVAILDAARKIVALEKDDPTEATYTAKSILLGSELRGLIAASPEERKQYVSRVAELIASGTPGRQQLELARETSSLLERLDPATAIHAYETLGPLFAKSRDKRLVTTSKLMEGAIRRLQLPGNTLQFAGNKLDGTSFDLAELKGKVVLLDMWATWCGPCLAEIPNLRRLYSKYQNQGFEIVGLSIDQDRPRLEAFLTKRELPWIILHDEENEGEHPVMTEYGIFGIPTMFLIGRDGKVIDVHARGESLTELLEAQFEATGE